MSSRTEVASASGSAEPPGPHWPVGHCEVLGDRGGAAAQFEYLLARGAIGALGALPSTARRAVLDGLVALASRCLRRPTRNARSFLRAAYGDALEPARERELVRAAYAFLACGAIEFPRDARRIAREGDLRSFDVRMSSEVERLAAAHAPVLVVSAHVGQVELLPAALDRIGFRPLYVVSRPPRNRPLSRWAQAQREQLGHRVIPRHGALDLIPRIFAGGGSVGMLLDQRARGRSVSAPFFGRPAECERSPGVLARRAGVPILVAGCARDRASQRLVVSFPRLFAPAELRHRTPEEIAAALNAEFERLILAYPEQYLWLHDRFRESGSRARASRRKGGANAG